MTAISWLARLVLPRYRTDQERLARLDRLRAHLMSEWEGHLLWGSGNVLDGVPTHRIVGLIDIARYAQMVVADAPPDYARARLREAIDDYLRDIDFANASAAAKETP